MCWASVVRWLENGGDRGSDKCRESSCHGVSFGNVSLLTDFHYILSLGDGILILHIQILGLEEMSLPKGICNCLGLLAPKSLLINSRFCEF